MTLSCHLYLVDKVFYVKEKEFSKFFLITLFNTVCMFLRSITKIIFYESP